MVFAKKFGLTGKETGEVAKGRFVKRYQSVRSLLHGISKRAASWLTTHFSRFHAARIAEPSKAVAENPIAARLGPLSTNRKGQESRRQPMEYNPDPRIDLKIIGSQAGEDMSPQLSGGGGRGSLLYREQDKSASASPAWSRRNWRLTPLRPIRTSRPSDSRSAVRRRTRCASVCRRLSPGSAPHARCADLPHSPSA